MLWLYLLGLVTFLTIALRRVLRRQKPLAQELYSKKVVVDNVQSGVAWVRGDGLIGSMNQSFARIFGCPPEQLEDREWLTLVGEGDRERARKAYSQMLLGGVDSFDCQGLRADGSAASLNVRLVAGYDHEMHFTGHHYLVEDHSRTRELERQLSSMKKAISKEPATAEPARSVLPAKVALQSQEAPGVAKV